MLIDLGSSSEIMYVWLFDNLGLKQFYLRPTSIPLFWFSGQAMLPLGLVTVQVGVGPIRLDLEFLVVDVPSPYNTIMGRTWIHRTKAVPSTNHQRIHFPTLKGMMEIKGNQVASRSCLIMVIKEKARRADEEGTCSSREAELKKQSLSGRSITGDQGTNQTDAAVEELKKITVQGGGVPSPEQDWMIGVSMTEEEQNSLAQLLNQIVDVFVWTPHEMPRVDAEVISHKLGLDLRAKPVI